MLRLGVNAALHRVMRICPNWYQKLPAPSSPTRTTADPDDGTVTGSSRSTGDQASSDSDSSRDNVASSDMDTTTGDCISCSDTNGVTIQTAPKKYQKRVQAFCRLSKGNLWTEAQLKRSDDRHQAMWGHDQESIQTEENYALSEDCNSFEMCRMMVMTDQLLCIVMATDPLNLHQRLGGQDPWLGEESGIVPETIPCPLLPFL